MNEDHPEMIFLWVAVASAFWLVVGLSFLLAPKFTAIFGIFLALAAALIMLMTLFYMEIARMEVEREKAMGPWFSLPNLYEEDER